MVSTRLAVLVCCALFSSACFRAIRVPAPGGAAPQIVDITRGLNSRTSVAEYLVPAVRRAAMKSTNLNLKLGTLGRSQVDLAYGSEFQLVRSNVPLTSVRCDGRQTGDVLRVMGYIKDTTKHDFRCNGAGFDLALKEPKVNELHGTLRWRDAVVELVSTNDMAKGTEDYVSGFHVSRDGRWLGAFEYFYGGKVYFAPGVSPEDRELVAVAAVAIVSTNGWLGNPADDNQPSASAPMGLP